MSPPAAVRCYAFGGQKTFTAPKMFVLSFHGLLAGWRVYDGFRGSAAVVAVSPAGAISRLTRDKIHGAGDTVKRASSGA